MASFFRNQFNPSMQDYLRNTQYAKDSARQFGKDLGTIGGTLMDMYNQAELKRKISEGYDLWDYFEKQKEEEEKYKQTLKDTGYLTDEGQEIDEDIVVDFGTIFDESLSDELDLGQGFEKDEEYVPVPGESQKMGEIVLGDVSTKDWPQETMDTTLSELQYDAMLPSKVSEDVQVQIDELEKRKQDLINAGKGGFDVSESVAEIDKAIASKKLELQSELNTEFEEDFETDLSETKPLTDVSVLEGYERTPEEQARFELASKYFKPGMTDAEKFRRMASLVAPHSLKKADEMLKYADEREKLELTLAEKKKTEDKFAKREEAYNNFAVARSDYQDDVQRYNRGEITIDQLQESFRNAEATKSKALGTGVPSSNLGLKSPLDFARQEDKDKIEMSKINQGAVKMVNDRIKGARTNATEFIKKYTEVKKAKNIIDKLKNAKNNNNPTSFFAAVKSLSNIIEPGLSVTEGEVKAYLGETDTTNFVAGLQDQWAALKNFNDLVAAREASKRKVTPEEMNRILNLATNLSSGVLNTYKGAATSGKEQLISDIQNDLDVSFSNVLDGEKYNKLINEVRNKYDAAFGLVSVGDVKVNNETNTNNNKTPPPKPKGVKGSSQSNPLPAPRTRADLDKLKGSGKWDKLPNGTVRKM